VRTSPARFTGSQKGPELPPTPAVPAWSLYLAVALVAVVVYLGALRNGYALDDVIIIARNPMVHDLSGVWKALREPYWPVALGATMYRPLPMASYAVDLAIGSVAWLHAVGVLWHAGVSVVLAGLTKRWTESASAALVAGLAFAVHPVHVEAVANLVGRSELMAALFTLLAVYAALERDRLWWSLTAFALGLLSKESAAVAPALIVWGWIVGFGRVPRRRMWGYVVGWAAVGLAYALVRGALLHPYARFLHVAPVFVGASPMEIRLTAIAALADIARLLVFPLTLRVDYSPDERTLVTTPLDPRFLLGAACLAAWVTLLVLAYRRGRRGEAFGLGWIGIAFLPVANLLFPTGVLVAERTLYLPSAGLALALGAWLGRLPRRLLGAVVTSLVVLGGVRTAWRVPIWRSTFTATLSVLDDSPRSFFGPMQMVGIYLDQREPERALEAVRVTTRIYDRTPTVFLEGADAAFQLGQPRLADSLLARMEQLCSRCLFYYRWEIAAARGRGDPATADSLELRLQSLETGR